MSAVPFDNAPVTILVADDNPTNVLLLARSLEKHGYRVMTADDGAAALEMARRHQPDLILMDVMMPELDGLEVCKTLKSDASTASIPIIFVTARTDPGNVVEGLSTGGADYIIKPFIIREVLARVAVHIRLRQYEKELLARNAELERLSEQLAEMNVELAQLTRTDPLTGMLNRRAWHEAMLLESERAARTGSPYALAMIDVDHFKAYNDRYGHQQGDECLIAIARAILGCCRCTDLTGRYGGEEFVLLCPDTGVDGVKELAERVRSAVASKAIEHAGSPVAPHVTISIGVSVAQTGLTWEEIVNRADEALYEAKRAGRNRVSISGQSIERTHSP